MMGLNKQGKSQPSTIYIQIVQTKNVLPETEFDNSFLFRTVNFGKFELELKNGVRVHMTSFLMMLTFAGLSICLHIAPKLTIKCC